MQYRTLFRFLFVTTLGIFLLVMLTACGQSKTVRVGSKDFTEQFIVGNMYADLLEANGIAVERKLNLGDTPILQEGLVSGQLDLYPEYTGTGLVTVLKQPSNSDPQTVYQTVKGGY